MKTRNIVVNSAVAVFLAIVSVTPIVAKTATAPSTLRKEFRNETQEMRKDVREDIKVAKTDLRKDLKDTRTDIRENVKEKLASGAGTLKKLFNGRATIGMGTVTAINGSILTVSQNSKTYTVNTGKFDTCTTQFRRRFWGSSSISEISVNDKVNVFGVWTDDAKTTVNACLVRDASIQKRFGVFFGNIISINSTGFTMSTKSENRANQTVTVSSTTTIVDRKEKKIGLGDIQIGNLVRVKGMWDNQANTITEVTNVKDFTIPIIPTPTVTP